MDLWKILEELDERLEFSDTDKERILIARLEVLASLKSGASLDSLIEMYVEEVEEL